MRFRASLLGVLFVLLPLAGCGGTSPTSPFPASTLLQPGTYVLSFSGFDGILSDSGVVPACPGIGLSGIRGVYVEVTLTFERGAWRARPRTPAGGTFEIQFAAGPLEPGGPGGGPGITGAAAGVAINTVPLPTMEDVSDSRVVLGGGALGPTASLGGGVSQDGRVAGGWVTGDVVFANAAGTTVPCNSGTVRWFLSIRF